MLQDQLQVINHRMFLHVVNSAHREPDGTWVLNLSRPHNNEALQRAFMSALLRAVLSSPADAHRDEVIEHSIADTSTMPMDEPQAKGPDHD